MYSVFRRPSQIQYHVLVFFFFFNLKLIRLFPKSILFWYFGIESYIIYTQKHKVTLIVMRSRVCRLKIGICCTVSDCVRKIRKWYMKVITWWWLLIRDANEYSIERTVFECQNRQSNIRPVFKCIKVYQCHKNSVCYMKCSQIKLIVMFFITTTS